MNEIYPEVNTIPYFGIIKCIKSNLSENDSRYLLFITKCNLDNYLIQNITKDMKKDPNIIYYLESRFADDIKNLTYLEKSIKEIKSYLEKDAILVMKNLSSIYIPLCELFDQRFSY